MHATEERLTLRLRRVIKPLLKVGNVNDLPMEYKTELKLAKEEMTEIQYATIALGILEPVANGLRQGIALNEKVYMQYMVGKELMPINADLQGLQAGVHTQRVVDSIIKQTNQFADQTSVDSQLAEASRAMAEATQELDSTSLDVDETLNRKLNELIVAERGGQLPVVSTTTTSGTSKLELDLLKMLKQI